MKKILFTLTMTVLYLISIHSQSTFSIKHKIMHHINTAGSVVVYGDTIICLGHGVDHNPFNYYASFVAKFDMQGNFLQRYTDTEGEHTYYYYDNVNKAYIVEDKIITAVEMARSPRTRGYVMIIDISSGEIEKKIEFKNNRVLDGFHAVTDFIQIDSINYAAVSSITENSNTNFVSPQISIINIETEEVKYIQLGKDDVDDVPNFLVWNGKKFLIGTYNSTPPYDILHQYDKRVTKGLIYEIDTSGSWDEVFVSDTMRGGVRKLLITKEGDYISTSNFLEWYNEPNTSKYIWHVRHMVFKLDIDYNLIWEKPYGSNFDHNWFYGSTRILSAEEEDGYILAGYQPNYPWNITQEGRDSMKAEGIAHMVVGILQKISEEGDSIWLRSYTIVNDTFDYRQEHFIRDMVYAPDGGYILYGDVNYSRREGDSIWNNPAWLLKVDKDGCFIPGCADTIDTTNIVNIIEDTQVMLYPNPTSDKLYVYQREAGLTRYTIHDISGAKVMEWAGDLASHTYIVDVSGYKAGVYVLSVERVGSRSYKLRPSSKKFVVE